MIVFPHTNPGDTLLVDGLTYAQEVLSRRSRNAKTFDMGGGMYRLCAGVMAVHHHDGKHWRDIDLSVTERDGVLVCDGAGYTARFDPVVPGVLLEGDQGEAEIVLEQIGASKAVAAPKYRLDGNEVVYDYGDYSIHAEVRPGAVEFYKLLKTSAAPRRFEWRVIKEKRRMKFSRKSAGRDAGKHNLQMATSSQDDRYIEEWTGKVGKIKDAKTRKKKWVDEVEYPVLVDAAVLVNVADASDTGNEQEGSPYWNPGQGTAGCKVYPSFLRLNFGARFQALPIPRGVKITEAHLKITNFNAVRYNMAMKLYGDLVSDAPAFANSDLPSGIDKSSQKVTMPATFPVDTPMSLDVAGIMNSIVRLDNWTAGNDMRFAMLDVNTASVTATHIALLACYPDEGFPKLEVVYTMPGPGNPLHGSLG